MRSVGRRAAAAEAPPYKTRKLSRLRTVKIYAGKRFVIQAVHADWSRSTTAAAVSP
jgi:hypothetical protein